MGYQGYRSSWLTIINRSVYSVHPKVTRPKPVECSSIVRRGFVVSTIRPDDSKARVRIDVNPECTLTADGYLWGYDHTKRKFVWEPKANNGKGAWVHRTEEHAQWTRRRR